MSGFEYHIRCPRCGLVSPMARFGGSLGKSSETELLAASSETGVFEVVKIQLDARSQTLPLSQLALAHSNVHRRLTSPVPTETGLRLDPEIACPRCGTRLIEAVWGGPETPTIELGSLDETIAVAHGLRPGEERRFVADGCSIECIADVDGDVRVHRWHLRYRAGGTTDLQSVARDLIGRLAAIGSLCTELSMAGRSARFEERPGKRTDGNEPVR